MWEDETKRTGKRENKINCLEWGIGEPTQNLFCMNIPTCFRFIVRYNLRGCIHDALSSYIKTNLIDHIKRHLVGKIFLILHCWYSLSGESSLLNWFPKWSSRMILMTNADIKINVLCYLQLDIQHNSVFKITL